MYNVYSQKNNVNIYTEVVHVHPIGCIIKDVSKVDNFDAKKFEKAMSLELSQYYLKKYALCTSGTTIYKY